jgi:hypothetical protein
MVLRVTVAALIFILCSSALARAKPNASKPQISGGFFAFTSMKMDSCRKFDSTLKDSESAELAQCTDTVVLSDKNKEHFVVFKTFQGMEKYDEDFIVHRVLTSIPLPKIAIRSAVWSGVDVLAKAASFCDGKSICAYKIREKYVGKAKNPEDRSFTVRWACDDAEKPDYLIHLDHDALDKSIKIKCELDSVISVSSEDISNYLKNSTVSFRSILASSITTPMREELGAECVGAINEVTAEGGSLRSRALAQSTHRLIDNRFASGAPHTDFFHWTSSSGLFDLFNLNQLNGEQASNLARSEHLYDQMFLFLRTRPADMYQFWRRVLYVAEDRTSSEGLGNKLVIFRLRPDAPTISYEPDIWHRAMKEIAAKYPSIGKKCANMDLEWTVPDSFGQVSFSDVFFIIAEDSGVDVM